MCEKAKDNFVKFGGELRGVGKSTFFLLVTRHISQKRCEIEGKLQWTIYRKPQIVSPTVA